MLGRCLIINIETRTAAEVIYVCLPVVNHTFMRLAGRALCSDLTSTISSLPPRLACKVKHMREIVRTPLLIGLRVAGWEDWAKVLINVFGNFF